MSSGAAPAATFRYSANLFINPDGSYRTGTAFDDRTGGVDDRVVEVQSDPSNSTSVLAPGDRTSVTLAFSPSTPQSGFYDGTYNGGDGIVIRSVASNGAVSRLLLSNVRPPSNATIPASSVSTSSSFALCFVAGTRILTARGEVAVEDLEIGDIAVTASGDRRPIVWVGQRHLDGAGRTLAVDQSPVRILAGAFGEGLPARDLLVSPGHPILVGAGPDGEGGVLVPAMCLVNGTSIVRTRLDAVTYWHVELDRHDILLAEGLPAESYFDLGSRSWFAGMDSVLVEPDFVTPDMKGRCRPVAVDGPVVEAEHARLAMRFAQLLAEHCAWNEGTDGIALQIA